MTNRPVHWRAYPTDMNLRSQSCLDCTIDERKSPNVTGAIEKNITSEDIRAEIGTTNVVDKVTAHELTISEWSYVTGLF
jgi:hypothetical protein